MRLPSTPPYASSSDSSASRRAFLGGLTTVVGTGLAGCLADAADHEHGETHDNTPDRSTPHDHESTLDGPVTHANVAMLSVNGHHFGPHIVWIELGGTVTWKLASGTHDTAAYHPANSDLPLRMPEDATPWDSDMLMQKGDTFDLTLDMEGVYDYFCSPHQYRGMVGKIIVGYPDPEDQPGLEPPQDGLPQEARAMLADLNDAAHDALRDRT